MTVLLIYLDSNIVIYLIEQVAGFGPRAAARIAAAVAAGDSLAVSDLTRLECRTLVISRGDHALLAQYDAFFARAVESAISLRSRNKIV